MAHHQVKKPEDGTLRIFSLPNEAQIYCPIFDGSAYITFYNRNGRFEFITQKGAKVSISQYQPLVKVGDHYQLA